MIGGFRRCCDKTLVSQRVIGFWWGTAVSRTVLNLDEYLPALLTQISNKWSRGSSRIYIRKFGVGINEWAVMSMLAVEPRITANRISSVIGMDKAAVGRSLKELEAKALVTLEPNSSDGRSKFITLTPAGYRMHDAIIKVALARERRALANLKPNEIRTLIELLNKVRSSVVEMQKEA